MLVFTLLVMVRLVRQALIMTGSNILKTKHRSRITGGSPAFN
jgi:hypothetical protein